MPLIFGETASGLLVPVLVDDDGIVSVSAAVTALVSVPSGSNVIGKVDAQNQGWIGAAWQKNPLALGYSATVTEFKNDLSASAGLNSLDGTACPAGEIWVIEAITAVNMNNAITSIFLQVIVSSQTIPLFTETSPAAAVWTSWTGAITLAEDDYISIDFNGCTLNDDIWMRYHGRRIDIDQ